MAMAKKPLPKMAMAIAKKVTNMEMALAKTLAKMEMAMVMAMVAMAMVRGLRRGRRSHGVSRHHLMRGATCAGR